MLRNNRLTAEEKQQVDEFLAWCNDNLDEHYQAKRRPAGFYATPITSGLITGVVLFLLAWTLNQLSH